MLTNISLYCLTEEEQEENLSLLIKVTLQVTAKKTDHIGGTRK